MLFGLLIIALGMLLVAGSSRYDGLDGLVMRVRAEFSSPEDLPQFIPTPLAVTGNSQAQALALLPTSTPTATPHAVAAVPTTPRILRETPLVDAARPDVRGLRFARLKNTPTPLPTPTELPTPTPLPTATPAPTQPQAPAPANSTLASSMALSGISHYWQTWNNCGPSTLAMNLSYFGKPLTQAETARALKPDKNDKNVTPQEMAAVARAQGLNAMVRVNGNADLVRRFLNAGLPVAIETWMDHDGGVGHYRLIAGYDDAASQWIVYDSFISAGVDPNKPYAGIRIGYGRLDELWRYFNRTYVILYDDAHTQAVQEILGADLDDAAMWQRSLEGAQYDVAQNANDAIGWFNLGSSLAAQGRYEEAATAFDQARVIGLPWRMLWYQFGPFQSYYETGRYDELLALADAIIGQGGNIEETFYWRGKALQAKGNVEGARQAFQRAVELNTNYAAAATALDEVSG